MKKVQINYERCIGCKHCEIACIIEHSSSKELFSCIEEQPYPKRFINVEVSDMQTYPVNCRHCDFPLCMNICPVSAIRKEKDGTVLIEPSSCIGCGMCAMACPFGVIKYTVLEAPAKTKRTVAVKCDGCRDRVKMGRLPACVEACKTGALSYESIEEYESKKRKEVVSFLGKEPQEAAPIEIVMWRDYLSRLYNLNKEE